ncbi:MFS transporter [Shouchella clausii]|uniref:MFS transporter n=1 Tax=Shouchella clausii TaxID=79880 RepID=UPI000BA7C9C0|nr:MFS transporter [Shouchella clausii]MBX0319166.1 MFS transporter [Shouchella clausii]PAE94545.1 MFS transporter [Shouchella clausii]
MWSIVLPSLAMIAVTYALARFSFGLFLPDIAVSLDLSEADGGFIGALAFASYTLALVVSSRFIRHFGQFNVVLTAGMSAIIGMLGIAFSPSFPYLAIAVFIAGLGSGLASPVLSQVAYAKLPSNQLDQANTWINSGTSIGLIITGPVVLLFSEHWRLSYLIFTIIGIIVLIWTARSISSDQNKMNQATQISNWGSVLASAKYLLVSSFIIGSSSSIYWTFSKSYLTSVPFTTANENIVFWMVMGIAGILGGLAGGVIQKIGLTWSHRLALLIMLASLIILLLPSRIAIYASASMFGSSYIFLTGLFIVLATRIFQSLPSLGVSLSFLALGIGQSIGSFLAGKTIELTSYPFAFILFAAIGIIALFIPVEKRMAKGKPRRLNGSV